ncbi:MAG TPA: ABC transporter substrate-binding protein [Terriglobales bacterium]|nr:ABC transporter substrate-binding protein [Terriglobales bacterium]
MKRALSPSLRGIRVLFFLLILHSSATAQELRRIHYGTTASTAHLPIWVGKDAGYFAKYGMNVEPVHIRGGALITMGIMSGQLQFSGAGAESAVAARVEGGDVVLLACPVDSDPVYFVARPEIKSPADLKGKSTAVTRLGSTTHFYLRAAARYVGLDPEKDLTILQLGTGTETATALENGRIAAAAITHRYALPFLQRGWPVLIDLSATDLVYPSSCVASSRSFVKGEPKLVENFLRAYVAAIQLIRKDRPFAEKSLTKWVRERDPALVKSTVEAYGKLFKSSPYVPDKGIENVLKDLANRRPVPKEFLGRPELFRDNGPLEKALNK